MKAKLGLGIRGIIKKIELVDTRTGEIVDSRKNVKNMLLNEYLNGLFTTDDASFFHGDGEGATCFIGSSDTEVSRDQNCVLSPLAEVDRSSSSGDLEVLSDNTRVRYVEDTFKFDAGEGTGTIREIGLTSANDTNHSIARQLVEPEIVKEDYHELDVVWRRELIVPEYIETVVSGGQRDGTTDITVKWLINNTQFNAIASADSTYSDSWPNPFTYLLSIVNDNAYVYIGDSNTESDIDDTDKDNYKGSLLYSGNDYDRETEDYISDSYTLTTRLGFKANQANGNIGELLIRSFRDSSTDGERTSIGRFTFDPPLDKVEGWRLFLDLVISLDLDPEVD